MNTYFPTWPVDGPPPLPPLFGLLAAAAAPAAGVRFVVDTALGPVAENSIAPSDAGLETGLYRQPDGTIWMIQPDGSRSEVYTPANAGRDRWIAGIAVYPYPGDTPQPWDACAGNPPDKDFGEGITPPEFAALTLSLPITCTSQQVPDQAAFRARAVATLDAVESFGVATEFMSGATFPAQPYLADGNSSFPNGSVATRPNHGLQILEKAIAATGRLGLIHCSPMLATALMGTGFALSDKSGVIRTINGIPVIPDFGYAAGAAPNGHPAAGATEEWAYATGPIDIRRSEIFTTPDTYKEALDRGLGATTGRTNTFTYRAERFYAYDWDTDLHVAVLIDRCSSDCVVTS